MKKRRYGAIAVFFLFLTLMTGTALLGTTAEVRAASGSSLKAENPKNQFVKKNGKWYYYDTNGKLAKGWFTSTHGTRYYFGKDGAAKAGILTIGGKKYCFNEKGKMLTAWQTVDGKSYFFDQKEGYMYTNWITTDAGNRYYFWPDGVIRSGWFKIDGEYYCLTERGKMMKNCFVKNGNSTYYLTANGTKAKGRLKIKSYWYAFDRSSGKLVRSGWYTEKDGSSYYAGANGKLYKNKWFTINGKTYYAKSDAALAKGWLTLKGNSYYLNSKTGERRTGWVTLKGKTYYLSPSTGILAKNQWVDRLNYVGEDGAVIPGRKLSTFRWPMKSKFSMITSYFGHRESPGGIGSTNHKGLDIYAPSGTPIYASAAGTVKAMLKPSQSGGGGNYTTIDHGNGVVTEYMHQQKFYSKLKVGQKVKKGDLIGYVGTTGNVTGPHLHFGMIVDGVYRDPLDFVTRPK